MFKNLKFLPFLLATLVVLVAFAKPTTSYAQRITIDQFLQLEREDQKAIIKNIRKFIVETDVLQTTNPQEFKRRQVLLKLWSNIIRKAHAEDYDLYANAQKLNSNGHSEYCMFAGWVSLMSNGKCAHPKNLKHFSQSDQVAQSLYKKYNDYYTKVKSKCSFASIVCNPLVFGQIDHCAPGAIPESGNASLSCWKAHHEQDEKMKKDQNRDIDDSIIQLLVTNKDNALTEFSSLLNRTYSMCLCKGYQVKDGKLKPLINYKYSNRLYAHRTCTSMLAQAKHFMEKLNHYSSVCKNSLVDPQVSKIKSLVQKLQANIDKDYERRLTVGGSKVKTMEDYYNQIQSHNNSATFSNIESKYRSVRSGEISNVDTDIVNDPFCKLDYLDPVADKVTIEFVDKKVVKEGTDFYYHLTYKIRNKDGLHNELDGYVVSISPKPDKIGATKNILIYKQLNEEIKPKVKLLKKPSKLIDHAQETIPALQGAKATLELVRVLEGDDFEKNQVKVSFKVLEQGSQKPDWATRYKVERKTDHPPLMSDKDTQIDLYEKKQDTLYKVTYNLVAIATSEIADSKQTDIPAISPNSDELQLISSLIISTDETNYPKEEWQAVKLELSDGKEMLDWDDSVLKVTIADSYGVLTKKSSENATNKKVKIVYHKRHKDEEYPAKYEIPDGINSKSVKPTEEKIPSLKSSSEGFAIKAEFTLNDLLDESGEPVVDWEIKLSFSYNGEELGKDKIDMSKVVFKLYDDEDKEITDKHVTVKDAGTFLLKAQRQEKSYTFEAEYVYETITATSNKLEIKGLKEDEDPDSDNKYSIKELNKEFDESSKSYKLTVIIVNSKDEEVTSLEGGWSLAWSKTYTEDDGDDDTEDEEQTDPLSGDFEVDVTQMEYEQNVTVKLQKDDEDKESKSTTLDASSSDEDDTDEYKPVSNNKPRVTQPVNPPPLPRKQKLFLRGKY